MLKICLFVMAGLPIPAVKGGAIETLIQLLLDENEKNKRFEFTVLCVYDTDAEKKCGQYRNAHFVYFRKYPRFDHALGMLSRGFYRLFRIVIPHSLGCYQALRHLRQTREYDWVINETWKVYLSPLLVRMYPKERIALHLHRKGETQKGDISARIDHSFAHLIAVSRFVANDWQRATERDAAHTHVLLNCCDVSAMLKKPLMAEKDALRASLGIREGEYVIIFVGRITAEKGVVELIRAIERMSIGNIHLLLIGGLITTGERKSKYELRVDRAIEQVSYSVSRTGYISNNDIYRYYAISDLAVLPSLCEEAAPLTSIEAMATGTPLITTTRGGIPEYSCEGAAECLDTGDFFVERLAQEMDRLLADPEARKQLSERAAARAMLFTPERYYEAFSQIIRKIGSDCA